MNSLENKNIILGITGGIAAYKAAYLVRLLKKNSANVHVVMTKSATKFITPLTMQALSGHPVLIDLFESTSENGIDHINIAHNADAFICAPLTANTLAKFANGIADNLLTSIYLATKAPIFLAPSMNSNMYEHDATQHNIEILKQRGNHIIDPNEGFQACGDTGKGRMAEPQEIINFLINKFETYPIKNQFLKNKNIVITAGPTVEPLDPVRFISNKSSGKMGYSIAQKAKELGANVTLISGPCNLTPPTDINFFKINTANELLEKCTSIVNEINADIFIACAAVADFRAKSVSNQKIKKQKDQENLVIELVKNPDILATIGHLNNNRPKIVVGFAAETNDVEKNAIIKLTTKGADFIVSNDVSNPKIGFNSDDNKVKIFSNKSLEATETPICKKSDIAYIILDLCNKYLE